VAAAAERPAALRYIAEDGATGYMISAWRLATALRAAGVDLEFLGWTVPHLLGEGETTAHSRGEAFANSRSAPDTPTVMHLVPEHLAMVRQFVTGPIVVHTVWETDRLPRRWPAALNSSEGVIVPTEWNREIFASCGVSVPIEVVPHVACEPLPGDGGEPLAIPEDIVVFYMISRWDERKAPVLAIQAFLEAFTADDPVALVVKTGVLAEVRAADQWGRTSPRFWTTDWQIARLLREHPRPPRIHLIVEDWDDSRIAGLHTRGDCYLTLTHGEGWGLGGADACVYGNPVIATGWSGHLAYLAGSDTLVDYDLVPVSHLAAGSYEPEQMWAQPRLEHAVQLLRRVAADPAAARAAAAPLRESALARFRGEVVAERFIDAMARLRMLGASA
jgi:glycosyltransferase involved in cell wall biosynthesis